MTPEPNVEDEREGVVDETSGGAASNDAPSADAGVEPEPQHAFQAPLPARELARDAPAVGAANLSPSACLAELRKRKLAVERDGGAASGIATPVRVTGPLSDVRFVAPGKKSVYGKLDCRLALVLDELAGVLARHGVASVRVDNLYRPKAKLPGRRTSSQHRYGLAVDVMAFELTDGTTLSVESDWHGEIGSAPCGPEARLVDASPAAIALRDLVCDIARSALFHHILTPSYNDAHHDHVHLDIKRGDKRSIIE
ncbi:MAG TPA: extensin family protein [Polyangiaceae bacterium]|nr:extensin family protein [Polyangiaceae bacterium]